MDEATLLPKLKERLKIFHDEEDKALIDIIKSAKSTLKNAIGFDLDAENDAYITLVIIRAMYVYNDAAEYFFENYRSEINDVILNFGGDENVQGTT